MKMVKKPVERVMSDKSMKLGNSFQGFLYGVCLTSLFFLTLTSFGRLNLAGISFSAASSSTSSSSQTIPDMVTNIDSKLKKRESLEDNQVDLLVSAWEEELLKPKKEAFLTKLGIRKSDIPDAPHFENCKLSTRVNTRFNSRIGNQTFPPWKSPTHPPWINGADEENYPLTRKVQRDIWIHQHPLNCMKPSVKFLVADWETLPSLGLGAQIVAMTGLLAIAIKENRVLVTKYYNRADHKGCRGESHATWSCYFFSETSQECRQRVSELIRNKEAWDTGILMGKHNYSSKKIWSGTTPRLWGEPWSSMQPTTEINGSFVKSHRKMDRRWWKAQAVRYLMRFQTEYTCGLMNTARNAAFGREAAKNVLSGVWSKTSHKRSEMEEYVWSSHKPWIPRPLLSVHVRMGDKASEMTIVSFEEYMRLADRIRSRFPHLNTIWLSTEMQEVVERIKEYPHWRFYYTEVVRQAGNKSMSAYESSLGRETSTNYPLVNFLMASEADFFTGALGSTWCFLIDGMRSTGGKVMSGYLSVNKHRFW